MNAGQRPDPRRLVGAVIDLLEPELVAEGYDLLDVRVFQGGGRLQLRIYVDTIDGGITLDQCAKASRSVGMLLEEADLINDRYVIEVSSPGIRRPLRTAAHYAAAVGQKVDLRTRDRRRVKGLLESTGAEGHVVRPTDEDAEPVAVTVAAADVVEGNLDPEFDAQALINADRQQKKAEKREKREKRRQRPGGRSRGRKSDDEKSGDDRTDGST